MAHFLDKAIKGKVIYLDWMLIYFNILINLIKSNKNQKFYDKSLQYEIIVNPMINKLPFLWPQEEQILSEQVLLSERELQAWFDNW